MREDIVLEDTTLRDVKCHAHNDFGLVFGQLGVETTKPTSLSQLVAEFCGQSVVPWQPIVGSNVFAHESGIRVKVGHRVGVPSAG